MRNFRWRVLVSRLMLCGLVAIFAMLAIRPMIRSAIEGSFQSVTGTRTTVADIRASLTRSRVQLVDLRVADSHDPDKDLFRAALVDLELDRSRLLRRELVVRRGQVTGLEMVADVDSMPLIPTRETILEQAELSRRFERATHGVLNPRVDSADQSHESLPSLKLAKSLLQRWPAENAEIEVKAEALKSRSSDMRHVLAQVGENPLRSLHAYQEAIADMEGLGREIYEVRRNVEQIRQQMEMDRQAVSAARVRELADFHANRPQAALDPDELSEYLLRSEVADEINTVLKWVQRSRRYLPALTGQLGSTLERGVTVRFAGAKPTPKVAVDTLVIRGIGRFGHGPVNLEGTIRHLSSEPERMSQPTEITLQTSGDIPLLVQSRMEIVDGRMVNHMVMDCPKFPQPRRLVGDAKQLSIVVAPGDMHLWARLELTGDKLQGEIVMKQLQPAIAPQIHADFGGAPMSEAMMASMPSLPSLDISVDVRGSLVTPHWKLSSNLGPHVADGLQAAIQSGALAQQEVQMAAAHETIERQVRAIEETLFAKQQAVLESLQFGTDEIEQVRRDIASRMPSPETSPFRDAVLR